MSENARGNGTGSAARVARGAGGVPANADADAEDAPKAMPQDRPPLPPSRKESDDGAPLTCVICLQWATRPVRLPCKCRSLLCLECFTRFMESFSACLICRERIVPRLRRLVKPGSGLESLVDAELERRVDEARKAAESKRRRVASLSGGSPASLSSSSRAL